MRKAFTFCVLAAILVAGCSTSGEVRYAGRLDENDPSIIRGPGATGTTRDEDSRNETTRTKSNRVDIPVYEFAHMSGRTVGYGRTVLERYDARTGRLSVDLKRNIDSTRHALTETRSLFAFNREQTTLTAVTTKYRGIDGRQYVFHRNANDTARGFSSDTRTDLEGADFWTDTYKMRRGLDASRGGESLEAGRAGEGLEQLYGERVIGLHLWKYADRDLAADDVVITYTLVYYNTNNYDTGPTEISEPVPLLTDYIDKSATLPKEGVTVELLSRPDGSKVLRWSFPKGIKAGETNKMMYKVKVRLEKRYEGGSPDKPAEPEHP
ncbi:MAG: hypothetical protein IT462_01475 [Planctomycetes bacterium]|nr:hypothetical protein [Planctomycetota bacterium]